MVHGIEPKIEDFHQQEFVDLSVRFPSLLNQHRAKVTGLLSHQIG